MKNIDEILSTLKEQRKAISKGFYPYKSLKDLGELGFYASFYQHKEDGLFEAFLNIARISSVCANTGFCVWAQCALNYYLLHRHNQEQEQELFRQVAFGEILGGTGLSNPVKAFAHLEKIRLRVESTQGGYILNGSLPWVSNITQESVFAIIAKHQDSFIMALVCAKNAGITLKDRIQFCALQGSATRSVIFKDYFISQNDVISNPAHLILPRILPGFVLLQTGIALGIIQNAMAGLEKYMKKDRIQKLDKEIKYLCAKKEFLLQKAQKLAKNPYGTKTFHHILKLKLRFVKLALKASQTLMSASASNGFLKDSVESKILLESYLVGAITPSIAHIHKLLKA